MSQGDDDDGRSEDEGSSLTFLCLFGAGLLVLVEQENESSASDLLVRVDLRPAAG